VAVAAGWLALSVEGVFSQTVCDRSVRGLDGPQGYRPRGDRCEGLYWQPHAQEAYLSVVGLRRVDTSQPQPLPPSVQVAWASKPAIPANADVSIRSVLLRSDKYYQMDTAKPYGAGTYRWPTDVLRALDLALQDLGIYAFTSVTIGQTPWKVYLPLGVGTPADGLGYEVTVVPGTMLLNLKWRCSRIDADGIPGRELGGATLTRRFPAGEPIRFRIALPQYEGFSYVEISADPLSPALVSSLHIDFAFLASR
jgi:hypothetical protein